MKKMIFSLALSLASIPALGASKCDDQARRAAIGMGEQNGARCEVTSHQVLGANPSGERHSVVVNCSGNESFTVTSTFRIDAQTGYCMPQSISRR